MASIQEACPLEQTEGSPLDFARSIGALLLTSRWEKGNFLIPDVCKTISWRRESGMIAMDQLGLTALRSIPGDRFWNALVLDDVVSGGMFYGPRICGMMIAYDPSLGSLTWLSSRRASQEGSTHQFGYAVGSWDGPTEDVSLPIDY